MSIHPLTKQIYGILPIDNTAVGPRDTIMNEADMVSTLM